MLLIMYISLSLSLSLKEEFFLFQKLWNSLYYSKKNDKILTFFSTFCFEGISYVHQSLNWLWKTCFVNFRNLNLHAILSVTCQLMKSASKWHISWEMELSSMLPPFVEKVNWKLIQRHIFQFQFQSFIWSQIIECAGHSFIIRDILVCTFSWKENKYFFTTILTPWANWSVK